ncbi:unnamed protein product [Psylliodes chrysocephalus]|uniref:Cyclic nucleotide-binding domain-containing protein n=1 Tax=Psylliodes chrysocephalus TaxID=3402493 RepID=A0A9P0D4X4_9CUCU|nr:unnamed protein product [Psylliodes chrysocephala]
MNVPYNEHNCKLIKGNPVISLLRPLHPGASRLQRFARALKTYILLDLDDYRCNKFFTHPSLSRAELKRHANGPYHYIIHPFSKISKYVQRIFFLVLTHRCIFDILNKDKPTIIQYTCYIRDIINCFIMMCFFMTGYVNYSTREVFIQPSKIRKHYLKTYFLVDLYLATDEFYWMLPLDDMAIVCKIVSKILYVVRFKSIDDTVDSTLNSLGFGKNTVFILFHFWAIMVCLHIFTELIYWIPTQIYISDNIYPNTSWVFRENLSFHEYTIDTYAKSFLIVLSYFLGAAYNDYVREPNEQLLLAVLTFTGRFYVLIIIAKVLSLFGHSDISQSDYENRLYQLCNYMRTMKVPEHLQSKIIDRLKYNYQKKFFDEKELLSIFTEQIKTEIFLYGARNLVNNNTILGYLPKHELAKLFVYMKSQIFDPDELIQHYKSKQRFVFFISSGTVACYTKEGLEFLHLKDGDIFGMLNLQPKLDALSSVTYVATEMTEIYFVHYKYLKLAFADRSEYLKYFNEIRTERIKIMERLKKLTKSGQRIIFDLKRGVLLEKPKRRYMAD